MIINVVKTLIVNSRPNALNNLLPKYYGIYKPDYLKLLRSNVPVYPPLLIRIRGYDYPILESYQSWVDKIIKAMKFHIIKSYAMPSKDLKIVRLKKNSTEVELEYLLKIYERNFQISEVTSIALPIFIRFIEAGLPEGVMLNIDKWNVEHENNRYLIDPELSELKSKLKSH